MRTTRFSRRRWRLLALGLARCRVRRLQREMTRRRAAAARERRRRRRPPSSPATSPAPARASQEAAQQAWIAGFQEANPDVTIAYDPVGSGGGREQFVAGRHAFGGTDSHLKDEELTGRPGALRWPRQPDRDPRLHLADRGHLQPRGRRQPATCRPRRWRRSSSRRSRPGTTRRSRPTTRTRSSRDERITAGQPLRRVGHDRELRRVPGGGRPGRLGLRGRAATGPSRAARPRRAPPASSTPSRPARARSATPTPPRRASSARPTIKVGEEFVAPDARGGRQDRRSLPGDRRPGRARLHVRAEPRRPTEAGTYPIVLVSYLMACTTYDDAAQGALVKGFLELHHQRRRSAGRRAERRLRPDQRTRSAPKLQPAVDAIAAN